jgi:CheY-like chemotaxis protein
MIRSPVVVVVDADAEELHRTERALEASGFVVMAVTSFPAAKALLGSVSPELVVAAVKLSAFNGLHLAALSIAQRPSTPFILTHDVHDVVLESDARRLGALYVVVTPGRQELTRIASEALESATHQEYLVRQWPRKGAPHGTAAQVPAGEATIVDVSYGGVRLKVPGEIGQELPEAFELLVPSLNLSLLVARAWAARDAASDDGWICGAAISDERSPELVRWRRFVDSVDYSTV